MSELIRDKFWSQYTDQQILNALGRYLYQEFGFKENTVPNIENMFLRHVYYSTHVFEFFVDTGWQVFDKSVWNTPDFSHAIGYFHSRFLDDLNKTIARYDSDECDTVREYLVEHQVLLQEKISAALRHHRAELDSLLSRLEPIIIQDMIESDAICVEAWKKPDAQREGESSSKLGDKPQAKSEPDTRTPTAEQLVAMYAAGQRNFRLSTISLKGASLSGFDLRGAELQRAEFHDATLSGARFDGGSLVNCAFNRADLREAKFDGVRLHGTGFENARLKKCSFRSAHLVTLYMNAADFCEANLEDARISACSLGEARFHSANLQRVVFLNCDLVDTDFSHADLRGATIDNRGGMAYTRFDGADIRGANLEKANLETAKLASALYDEQTRWPAGFDPVQAGAKTSR